MKKDTNTKLYDYDIEDVKKISIKHFVISLGHKVKKKHRYEVTNSPLSDDTNPSFIIYPENNFYDFSTGIGGTIIDLVMNLYSLEFKEAMEFLGSDSTEKVIVTKKPKITKQRDVKFNIETYFSKNPDNMELVKKYMDSRLITYKECNAGLYFTKEGTKWQSNLSLMFYHRDEFGNICGAKFRNINPTRDDGRWSSRGRLFYNVIEDIVQPDVTPTIFITESETSSNSLYNYFKETGRKNFVILCFGGVNSAPKLLPLKYDWCKKRYIIIDFDGSEKDYNKRIGSLSHLQAKDIKIVLPKGEDINSVYAKREMYKYNNLFDKIF